MVNKIDEDTYIDIVRALCKAGISRSASLAVLGDLDLESNAALVLIDLVYTQHYVRKAGRPSLLLPVSSASRKQMVLGALIFILGVFGSIYLTCQIKHEFFNIMRDDTWVN